MAGVTTAWRYMESRKKICPFSAFQVNQQSVGSPIDRMIFWPLASNEVPHAAVACRFRIPVPTVQTERFSCRWRRVFARSLTVERWNLGMQKRRHLRRL